MRFAGMIWRLLVGVKDALALLFLLLFFMALYALMSIRPAPHMVREGALLLKLDGAVVEEISPIDPLNTLLSSAVPTTEYAARDVVRAIDAAAADKRIKVIALDLSTFLGGGQVHLSDISEALARFRAAEKPVIAYAVAYSDDALKLAAQADEVWVDPLGGAALTGPGGSQLFYAGLLDRLGITANVFRVGTYKSAVEPYMMSSMSPESKENAQALYGSLWAEWQAQVQKARPQANIDLVTSDVAGWLAASQGDVARATLAAGLADKMGTQVQWGERIAALAGKSSWDKAPGSFAATELSQWIGATAAADASSRKSNAVGVITIAGEISDGDAGPGSAGAERIVRVLDEALDDGLKALVIRVDSPGGTVTGSEAIRRAVERHRAAGIPVAVSFGNVAASGGYWIATSGQRIFAEPETITGSIGIFGVLPSFEGALTKLGVGVDGVQTTPLSGQPDFVGGLTPEAKAVLQASVDSGYQRFLSLVAKSRGMTVERADQVGQGRVWDGGTARQLGLVDEFGGLEEATAWAAKQAKLADDTWSPVYLGADAGLYPAYIRKFLPKSDTVTVGRDVFSLLAARETDIAARVVADLRGLLKVGGVQARCMECPAVPSPSAVAPSSHGERSVLDLLAAVWAR